MRRLLVAAGLLLVAGAAHAFDATPERPRIGVLRAQGTYPFSQEGILLNVFHQALYAELRERGFDVVEVEVTFDELAMNPDRDADWYVEIVSGEGETVDYGGVGVGGRHADLTLGLLVSRIGADANVYRGRTLELVATESLKKRNTALVPTSVGVGGRSLFAAIALPFVERAHARRVARSAGRELAGRVTNVVRAE